MAHRIVSARGRSIRQVSRIFAATSALLLVAGCQSNPPPGSHKTGGDGQLANIDNAQPRSQPTTGAVVLEPPKLDPAAFMLDRMKDYATRLDPVVDQHLAGGVTANKAASPKSSVVWTDTGPATQPVKPTVIPEVVPLARPIIDSTPSHSNTMAALPGTGTSNPAGVSFQVTSQDLNRTPAPLVPAPYAGDPLEQTLSKHIKEYPRDIWAHLDYELLQFVHERRDPLMASTTGLPSEDRELVRSIIDGISNFREAVRSDPNLLMGNKVKPFLDLADRLRAQADLIIPCVALCKKVDGFGAYEEFEPARFVAGKEHMAIVYCEVGNFASQMNDRKQWETRLTQETVLYREDGLAVWQDKTKSIVDSCHNRRHDFFIVKMVKLPSTLTIGRYLMKVTIQDMQASRVAEATIPVEVVAQ